ARVERGKSGLDLGAHRLVRRDQPIDIARLEAIEKAFPETRRYERGDSHLGAMQPDPAAVRGGRHVEEVTDQVLHAGERGRPGGRTPGEARPGEQPREKGEGAL